MDEIAPGSWAYQREFDERGRPLVCSRATAELTDQLAGGYCHVLALVLHERHGWPIRALGRPADSYSISPWHGLSSLPTHVYCLRDDGRPVDVYGVHADEQAIRRFYAHQHNVDEPRISISLSADALRDELPQRGFPPIYDKALAYTRQAADYLSLHTLAALDATRPSLSAEDGLAGPALADPEGPATAEL
jgi:hypothetical protein